MDQINLQKAYELDQHGETEKMLDFIYDTIDQAFRNGEFDLVNNALPSLDLEKYSVDFLLGILCSIMPARSKLSHTNSLIDKIKKIFSERQIDPRILIGLV